MTPRPLAFRNGQMIDAADLAVAVTDAGFVQGLTVAEQLRTFAGRLFRLDEHLQRLSQSLEIVGVEIPFSLPQLAEHAERLVEHNFALLPAGHDLGLSMFVTPGTYGAYRGQTEQGPLVAMHTTALRFGSWAHLYDEGQRLVVASVRQVPQQCWPAALKCRSRMHYYLADREAAAIDPQARALLLDLQGNVMEASTANIVLYRRSEGLLSPPRHCILPGISVAALQDLANQQGLPFSERPLTVADVHHSDEMLLCSTSLCVVPVTAVNGRPIGDGRPGPRYRQLLQAWSDHVQLDIRQQAVDRAAAA